MAGSKKRYTDAELKKHKKEYCKKWNKKWHSKVNECIEPARHIKKSRQRNGITRCDTQLIHDPNYHSAETASLPDWVIKKLREQGVEI